MRRLFYRSGNFLIESVLYPENDTVLYTQAYAAHERHEAADLLNDKLAPGSQVRFVMSEDEEDEG